MRRAKRLWTLIASANEFVPVGLWESESFLAGRFGASGNVLPAKRNGVRMVRISAIFIAVCMVLIAASLGAVLYLRFGFSVTDAALVALVSCRRGSRSTVPSPPTNVSAPL